MGIDTGTIWIGWDGREAIAADVCKYSIERRTYSAPQVKFLKHRELRKQNIFRRPWVIDADTGNFRDFIDSKPFSTEFSHTRFLIPYLQKYKGWALFMDCDMIFQSDVKNLFKLCDDKFAIMCVKHSHIPQSNAKKMDDREQTRYYRKNWSSFVLWNCEHEANRKLTPEKINFMSGSDLHAFNWLDDSEIGSLQFRYNYISGVSPPIPPGETPYVIHYSDGGPWMQECAEVPYAGKWIDEHNHMIENAETQAHAGKRAK